MKSERRHELETNQLADWAGTKMQRIAPYTVFIVIGLLALVALTVGGAIYSSYASARRGAAWQSYFKAVDEQDPAMLAESAKEYSGSDAAGWALVKAGNQVFQEGVPDFFTDKQQALKKLEEAEDYYNEALKNAGRDQARRQCAKFGLAQVLEEQGKVNEALVHYNDLTKVAGPLGERAKVIVAELSDKNSPRLAWATFHLENDPKPPGMSGFNPGGSGSNPFGNPLGSGGQNPLGNPLGSPGTGLPGTGGSGVLDGIGEGLGNPPADIEVTPNTGSGVDPGVGGGEFQPPTTEGGEPDAGGEPDVSVDPVAPEPVDVTPEPAEEATEPATDSSSDPIDEPAVGGDSDTDLSPPAEVDAAESSENSENADTP